MFYIQIVTRKCFHIPKRYLIELFIYVIPAASLFIMKASHFLKGFLTKLE